jgi:propanediol dehydratase large subunit
MCINVYAFAPDEQEISCCSCLLTPNSVANLGVNRDLTSTTLTGVVPTSVVIKLVATLAGSAGAGTSCSSTAATEGTLANGLVAYGTTPQPAGTAFSAVEHTFVPSTLSASEYASITSRCAAILGNGSGFGVCNSCKVGALGAGKQ